MKKLIPLIIVLVFCLWTSLEAGQIYEWIDKNEVKHFTNEPPPPGAKVVNAQKAIPYDKAADQNRTQEDQAAQNQDLEQQESQTVQQAASQQETPGVQADSSVSVSESNDDGEGVIVNPYVRNRKQIRRDERRRREGEDIVQPPIDRNRPRGRIR